MPLTTADLTLERADAVARAAAAWRDPHSDVRQRARAEMAGGAWSAPVIETALDHVLADLDRRTARALALPAAEPPARALAILPGNVVGPALASAFCAALAGARCVLKMAGAERVLGGIVADQFAAAGPPLADIVRADSWRGGDLERESQAFAETDVVVAFGDDGTLADVRRRLPARTRFVGYGAAYGLGILMPDADVDAAAVAAARDVATFDQRGCMSPQTIYVVGSAERAAALGAALARELQRIGARLPRSRPESGEAATVADVVRRARLRAEHVWLGPWIDACPEYVVSVEPFGPPQVAGLGRVVTVMPAAGAPAVARVVRSDGRLLDTLGIAGAPTADIDGLALRTCALGLMQRPPFGHRPRVRDFA